MRIFQAFFIMTLWQIFLFFQKDFESIWINTPIFKVFIVDCWTTVWRQSSIDSLKIRFDNGPCHVMNKLTLTSSFIWSLVAKSTDRPLLNAKLHHTILKMNVKFRWSLIIHNFRQFEFPRRLTNFRNWSKNRSFFKESYHGRTYLGLQKSSWNKFFTKKNTE